MSFKKLSFLYLVFILFLFFSSPGQYVGQYVYLAETQNELNTRLLTKLKNFASINPADMNLKNTTLECLNAIEGLNEDYLKYAKDFFIVGDKLRESQFAEKTIRKGPLSARFEKIVIKYNTAYKQSTGKDLDNELIKIKDFNGNLFANTEFYFKETPNGVLGSVFEHLKTVFLYNSIANLYKEKVELPKFEQLKIEEASFIQRFKRLMVLGNPFELTIKPESPKDNPIVNINGKYIDLKKEANGNYSLSYTPSAPGKYAVEVMVGPKHLFTGFEVMKPEFRFIMEESSFEAMVGKKLIVSLDSQYFPSKNVRFTSDKAEVLRRDNQLFITPLQAGRFHVSMIINNEVADDFVLYAHEPEDIMVGLLDIGGNQTSLDRANRLESLNTFWQVVSFRMTVIDKNGEKDFLRSATRFLRNDLRALEENAAKGSTVIFDEIKLVGKDRNIVKMGRPIIIIKE